MATWYSQSSGLASTLSRWNSAANGSGSAPTAITDLDDDAITIQAGHVIDWDVDSSGWTNGMQTFTITGISAGTPGTLRIDSTTLSAGTYCVKMKTGCNIVGTSATVYGRILINSDGVWGNTGALAFDRKAIFLLSGTASLTGAYLSIEVYCTQPQNLFARTYSAKFTVNSITASSNTITCASAHGWSAGRAVCVRSSGTLPAPLEADVVYYVTSPSGADLKLYWSGTGPEVDLTEESWTGTLEIYSGYDQSSGEGAWSGVTAVNVLETLSSDTPWTDATGHNAVVLWDRNMAGSSSCDYQRTTIASGGLAVDGHIDLSDALDSEQSPGARIYLCSRNVSIRSSSTSLSTKIVDAYNKSVLQCEIRNTAGSGTTNYGYGACGTEFTMSGIIATCYSAMAAGGGGVICSGIVCACSSMDSNSVTFTSTAIISNMGAAFTTGAYVQDGCEVFGFYIVLVNGTGVTINKARILGGYYGQLYVAAGTLFDGTIFRNCAYLERPSYPSYIVYRNIDIKPDLVLYTSRYYRSFKWRLRIENLNGVNGSSIIYDNCGNIIKTACDGTGDAPSVDPEEGHGYCIEASNIQSHCGEIVPYNNLRIVDDMRIWLTAASHTVTFKVQTTYAGITAGNLKLTCRYYGVGLATTETTHAPAISERANAADWSQTLSVTFEPSAEGWATFSIDLMEYQAGDEVYVWPEPTIT